LHLKNEEKQGKPGERFYEMVEFKRFVFWLSKKFNWVAAAGIVALMALTFTDVFLRYFFRSPVRGTYEVSGLIGLVIISFALGQTQIRKSHISVDFLTLLLPRKVRTVLASLVWLISLCLSLFISWRSGVYAFSLYQVGETTQTEKISLAPFEYIVAAGFGVLCLVFLVDLINSLSELFEK
jgi:TRAP-type C4-dicarboxylate transport system permease small subunit